MPSLDLQVTTSLDDYDTLINSGFMAASLVLVAGNYNAGSKGWRTGMVFRTANIPQGSTITVAYLTFRSYSTLSTTVMRADLCCEDEDDATACVNAADFVGRSRTAPIAWDLDAGWTQNVDYQSPSIVAPIQSVISRGGWVAGNDLQVFWEDKDEESDLEAYRQAYAYDGSATYAPKLHIEWTEAPSSLDLQVAANLDDVDENEGSGAVSDGSTSVPHRSGTVAGVRSWGAHRVVSGSLPPQGATITVCYAQLYLYADVYDDANGNWHFEKATSPAQFALTDYNVTGRPRTTASASWIADAIAAGGADFYQTPSLVDALQELVDSYSPTALVLIYRPNTDATKRLYSRSHNYDSALALKIHIEWTAGDINVTPSPAEAVASVIAPTPILGSTTATPTAIEAIAEVVQPSVGYEAQAQALFDLVVFDEVVFDGQAELPGDIILTPAPASAIGSVVAPTVIGAVIAPTAITQAASNIGPTTARINGKVTDDGGESCEARFRWRKKTQTEEQTQENGWSACLRADTQSRAGQRLTISNRKVTKLGFLAYKVGSPTGDLTFTIRKVSDHSIIVSKVWGDLSNLGSYPGSYIEVTFDSPVTINEEVRILGEVSTGDADNRGALAGYSTNVKEGECHTYYTDAWHEGSPDVYYKYTYEYAWVTTEWQNTLGTNDTYYADLTELDDLTEYEFQTQAKNTTAGEGDWSASAYFLTTLTPAYASSIAQVVQPTVKQGNIIFSPTLIEAIAQVIHPTVIYGPIIPDPAGAIATGVNPVVVLTSISITPTLIEAIGHVVAPFVSGGVLYVLPAAIDAIGTAVSPTVILGSISLTPGAVAGIGEVIQPNVIQASLILSPSYIEGIGQVVAPTVLGGSITLEPESAAAIASGVNPSVLYGSTTVTPEFVTALAGVIAPTVLQTWIGRKLRLVIMTSQYRQLKIVTAQKRKLQVVTGQKRKVKVVTGV